MGRSVLLPSEPRSWKDQDTSLNGGTKKPIAPALGKWVTDKAATWNDAREQLAIKGTICGPTPAVTAT